MRLLFALGLLLLVAACSEREDRARGQDKEPAVPADAPLAAPPGAQVLEARWVERSPGKRQFQLAFVVERDRRGEVLPHVQRFLDGAGYSVERSEGELMGTGERTLSLLGRKGDSVLQLDEHPQPDSRYAYQLVLDE